jgi:preprotein translocase subunit YajC
MIELIHSAFAQEIVEEVVQATAKQPSPWTSMIPLVLIMVVFYFLLIRPQQKKLKEHQMMVRAVGKGDEVVTSGGIFGEIMKVEEESGVLHLKIADNVQIRVRRDMISEVSNKPTKAHSVKSQAVAKQSPKGKARK